MANPFLVQIESLGDHLDLVETLAAWHWGAWGRPGALPHWTETLRARVHHDRVPATFVALADDRPLGSVSVVAHDMSTHPELGPWLSAVFVSSDARGQGIGTALVGHAVRWADGLGYQRVYLYTDDAPEFYLRLGWQTRFEEDYEGHGVAIMSIDCSRCGKP